MYQILHSLLSGRKDFTQWNVSAERHFRSSHQRGSR